jgi:drug/metabolite transporter (DMT)-like permease
MALACLFWGVSFVLSKKALTRASVFVLLGARFTVGALAIGLLHYSAVRALDRGTLKSGLRLGLLLSTAYALQVTGLQFTTASKTAFIASLNVIFVPVLMALFWGQRIGKWIWVSILAALVGLYLFTVPSEGLSGLNAGDLLVLMGTVVFTLHIIYVGRYSPKHSLAGLSFVQVATTGAVTAAAAPVLSLAGVETPRFDWSPELLVAVVVLGVVPTAICFSIQLWAQRYTPPTHAAILFTLPAMFAMVASFLVLGERLDMRSLMGAGFSIAGILLAERKAAALPRAERT